MPKKAVHKSTIENMISVYDIIFSIVDLCTAFFGTVCNIETCSDSEFLCHAQCIKFMMKKLIAKVFGHHFYSWVVGSNSVLLLCYLDGPV